MRLVRDSKIDGEFNGWDGDNVYELIDGSKWKQRRYRYRYRYRYRPRAKVWKDGSRYWLEVDGIDEKIEVKRVY